MCNYYLEDSIRIYTKENFPMFVKSSETQCYLMTYGGRIECIKRKDIQPFGYNTDYPIILLNADTMRGFKAFNKDWTCRGKQYVIGETFKEDIYMPIPCVGGMHFCNDLVDVFYYYGYDFDKTKVAEIEAIGTITTMDGEKFCTNELRVIREVYPYEILDSIRQSIYGKLVTKLPGSVVTDVMEKLELMDKRILKSREIIKEECDKING